MRTKSTLAALIAATVLLIAVGCSSDGSDDADSDSPTTEVSDSDSDATEDDSGTDGGDESDAVDLPEGWPDELALPDDTTVIEATDLGAGSLVVVARIDGDTEATFDALKGQLTDAGYDIVNDTFTPSDEGGFGSISAENDTYTVAIAFGPDPTGDTSQVTINVDG